MPFASAMRADMLTFIMKGQKEAKEAAELMIARKNTERFTKLKDCVFRNKFWIVDL